MPSPLSEARRALRRGDHAAARRLLLAAAPGDDPEVCLLLGQLLSQGVGGPADPAQAARWYEAAARAGSATACLNLGGLHATGRGVARDFARARGWYERAAALGDAEGHVRLGLMAATGEGGPVDEARAEAHWRQAVAAERPVAMVDLARLLCGRGGEALADGAELALAGLLRAGEDRALADSAAELLGWARPRLEELADRGSSTAAFVLGGMAMIEGQPAAAAPRFEAAAQAGHAGAQRSLGFLLEQGQGVGLDRPRAVDLYRRAAEGGDAEGSFNYAVHLLEGSVVARDPDGALAWLARAAERGLAPARSKLASLLLDAGRPGDATPWLQRAAEAGEPLAMLQLAALYRDGRGVGRDLVQAARWCLAPLARGNGDGIHELHGFVRGMTEEQVREAARLAGDEALADVTLAAFFAGPRSS